MNQRVRPTRPPSKLMPAILMIAIAILGFTTLMTRLETTREGYRLSGLNDEIGHLEDQNRTLRLQVAELSSHERLRSLAAGYHLAPPARGQVVMVP
ncbi:MAG TPA: cell division protein FtsL [Candidatus Binataceae bacterium]|nr:cell division protein FtsL [Candidatus Binataceae bacterium]